MSSCKFKTERDKIETARMYFQLRENILSFTCENSLGLYGTREQAFQMTRQDWQKFGMGIIQALKATMETEKEVIIETTPSYSEDLRSTQLSAKEPLKEEPKPLTAPKVLQPYKIKIKQKFQANAKKTLNEGFVNKKVFETTISKIFQKVQSTKTEASQQSIFNLKGIPDQRSLQIKARMNEIRQKFPSLTSKEQKSKQEIVQQMKTTQNEGARRRHSISGPETKKFTDVQRHSFVNKLKNQIPENPKDIDQTNLCVTEPFEKNQKKEFLQSIYHRKELKELKQHQKECVELGKNLIPSSQSIRQKLEQKKNRTFLNHHNNHIYQKQQKEQKQQKQQSIKNEKNQKSKQKDKLSKEKKPQREVSESKSDNPFEEVEISLKDIRVQRAITYDESYLAAQIMKARQMKQTEREYYEEDEVGGWINKDDIIYEENFSQNFDDSVNDEDSCDQDLPEHEKKYVLDYVRANQNAKRQKMIEDDESDEEKPEKSQQHTGSANIFGEKKRIHGFREISFKSVCNQTEERNYGTPTNKIGIGFATNSKIRKNPHKFQESLSIIKYKSFSKKIEQQETEFDPTQIYITHKKRLNQRSLRRQTRKDPFVLVSIKQKTNGKLP